MRSLRSVANKGKGCVYLLKLKNKSNDCFKLGYTSNLNERLKYYPESITTTILDVKWGEKEEFKAFERFIHDNCKDKYLWISRRFAGYTETYNNPIDIKLWYGYFKNGLPDTTEQEISTGQLENYIRY